jgi:hypothetical protein
MRLTTMKQKRLAAILVLTGMPLWVHAEGHGPIFGLATPTLGKGQWSSDTGFMRMETNAAETWRAREMLGYGITEDLQVTFTAPVGNRDALPSMVNARAGAMMGASDAVEASLLWRFHRVAPAVGMRRESSLLLGVADGAELGRTGMEIGPTLHAAIVTGFASRTTYWWLGAGAQRDVGQDRVQQGTLTYATAVFGWRPPVFRGDYPKPDWRLFIETVAERAERDRMNGVTLENSGGTRWLAGPSVLGLFGKWGVSAGVLLPIDEHLNGVQPDTKYRAKVVFTYWF